MGAFCKKVSYPNNRIDSERKFKEEIFSVVTSNEEIQKIYKIK